MINNDYINDGIHKHQYHLGKNDLEQKTKKDYNALINNTVESNFFDDKLRIYIRKVYDLSEQLYLIFKDTQSGSIDESIEILNKLKELEKELDPSFKPFLNYGITKENIEYA